MNGREAVGLVGALAVGLCVGYSLPKSLDARQPAPTVPAAVRHKMVFVETAIVDVDQILFCELHPSSDGKGSIRIVFRDNKGEAVLVNNTLENWTSLARPMGIALKDQEPGLSNK